MGRWRQEHPRATLSEIEAALDERIGATRAQMLEEAVLASEAATFAGKGKRERPGCPACGQALVSRGEAERTLTTTGGRDIRIRRSYGACPSCGLELFPPR
jgi:YgiT-type zinc finger domain-containing protein